MSPTSYCHFARTLLKAIGVYQETDAYGIPLGLEQPNPWEHLTAETFRKEWLRYNLLRKALPEGLPREMEAAMGRKALDDFLLCEANNARLNATGLPKDLSRRSAMVLLRARQIVQETIGDSPDIPRVLRNAAFTGGASTSRKRSEAHPVRKLWASPKLHVTPLCLSLLLQLQDSCEALLHWDSPSGLILGVGDPVPFYDIVPGGRFDVVDKNYKTKRTIIIEPDGNMLIQRGIGVTIRDLLFYKWGVNLRCQKRNQKLAYRASIDGEDATIDVENASNTISSWVVGFLLPEAWYELLYQARSHVVRMPDGMWQKLEMFSSMGNGFTFELESLIFYALARACAEVNRLDGSRVSVFGDDIVVPTAAVADLIEIFEVVGFKVNTEKSFWLGPFRESCGKHYFRGADVTPFYLSGKTCDEELFRVANTLHYWETADFQVKPSRDVLNWVVRNLSRCEHRPQIPLSYPSNCGLYSPLYSHPIKVRWNRKGYAVMLFRRLIRETVSIQERFADEALWLDTHFTGSYSCCWLTTTQSPGQIHLTCGTAPVGIRRETGRLQWKTVAIPYLTQVTEALRG